MRSLMDDTADLQAGQSQGAFGWNRHFFVVFRQQRRSPSMSGLEKELSWICSHHNKYKKSTSQDATNVTRTADEHY